MTVTEIQVALRWEQSVVSQHLSYLRHAKVCNVKEVGKGRVYSINQESVTKIKEIIRQIERL